MIRSKIGFTLSFENFQLIISFGVFVDKASFSAKVILFALTSFNLFARAADNC